MQPGDLITAAEIDRLIPSVSRFLVGMWRRSGKLQVHGMRGRSPLYRWSEVVEVERQTRQQDPAHQRSMAS